MKEKKTRYQTVYLVHSSKGHSLHVTMPRQAKIFPGSKTNGGVVVRMWFNFEKGFFDHLRKQKNPKRLCPRCTSNAYNWESKWNPSQKLQLFKHKPPEMG